MTSMSDRDLDEGEPGVEIVETSPRPGPMAFTIDLGDENNASKDAGKKLGLKDGIRHFAPTKKTVSRPTSSGLKRLETQESKEANNNNSSSKNVRKEPHYENNNDNDNGDQCSEAGTYTIEDEEDEEEEEENRRQNGYGNSDGHGRQQQQPLNIEKLDTHAFVSQWAHSVAAAAPSLSPGSSIADRDEGGSSTMTRGSRRRLPPVPGGSNQANDSGCSPTSPLSSHETENYLQDTISVMAAMEARISDEGNNANRKAKVSRSTSATPMRKDTFSVEKSYEDRKLAWERRKNYDPLRASGKLPGTAPSPKPTKFAEDSFSEDTCSEVEQHSLPPQTSNKMPSTRPNRAFALRKKLNTGAEAPAKSSPEKNMSRSDGGRYSLRNSAKGGPSPKAKTTPTPSPVKKKPQPPQLTARKHTADGRSTSSLSSKEAEFQAWKRRKNYNPLIASGLSKRQPISSAIKTSTTTTNAVMTTSVKSDSSRLFQKNPHHVKQSQQNPQKNSHLRSYVLSEENSVRMMMQRSASFHYPDGLSRVQQHVYCSSEDDESSNISEEPHHHHHNHNHGKHPPSSDYASLDWERRSELFEVNDDEFILPIGGSNRSHRPSNSHLLHPHHQAQSPRSGSGRMEALDNLVISTIFSISTKLCLNSASLIRRSQERAANQEQVEILDTLLYVLEDTDPPASPSKKTSRELAGTLRNLKKVEQALQLIEGVVFDQEEPYEDPDDQDVEADDESPK